MRARKAFTIAEILVSLMLLMVIMGAAVQFFRKQTGLVTRETSRMDAMQNAQFATSQIDRELRQAGAGTTDFQPMLVQVDSEAMTFNANMVSIDTGDVRAVYQIQDADTNGTRAMLKSERTALPNSSVLYPDTTYFAATGAASGAETISYYLRPDSTTSANTQDYFLFRRVNALAPTMIARGVVKDSRDTIPFFTYYKTDTLNRLKPILKSQMPLIHVLIHGAQNDTGSKSLTDSIRAVRLHFITATRDPRTGVDALRTVETLVRIMNSGLVDRSSCGQPPYSGGVPTGVSSAANVTPKFVNVTWTASVDDAGGEKDIERYAIFRRLAASAAFGDPISSIPASKAASYTFKDTKVVGGESYVYGVAAQDCTPLLSAVTSSASVTVITP
ncbi:MAG: hypothetical protein V4550_14400 [Gemmatimonadota bacterium]